MQRIDYLYGVFIALMPLSAPFFSRRLIAWYTQHRRRLPWRDTSDPYRIWLSEVILQQTRVAQGLPYYERFIQRFPTVNQLAAASLSEVLRLWQGLGYYRRARHLHACACEVAQRYDGHFPDTYAELLALPGIGAYTAAAIASIAFERPEAVVDGNVYRVLSRVFGMRDDIATQRGRQRFASVAQKLLDRQRPSAHNQAVMEFGALCCTPRCPRCLMCPLSATCVAYAKGEQRALPRKTRKTKVKNRYLTYFVFQKGEKMALYLRSEGDIWSGLYDFYHVETRRYVRPEKLIAQDAFLAAATQNAQRVQWGKIVKHTLSHQRIRARFVETLLKPHGALNGAFKRAQLAFYDARRIAALPKSALLTRYLAKKGVLNGRENQ